MLVLRQNQMTIWDYILPEQIRHLNNELSNIDKFLDDDKFLQPFVEGWNVHIGRGTVPVETYIRMMYLKYRYNLGYEALEAEVNDSIQWRRFCRIPLDKPVPDSTTLIKSTHKYGENTIKQLNDILVAKATHEKLIRSRKLRIDTTVVEANVHYPTDAQLLADGIKSITRKVKQLEKDLGDSVKEVIPKVTDRCRSAKKTILKIAKVLKRRSKEAIQEVREITEELVDKAIETVIETKEMLDQIEGCQADNTKPAKKKIDQLDNCIEITEKIIRQTRKVNRGEKDIPDRIVSLHDPDARPIRKGKFKNPTEFGYKVEITETDDRIVTDFKVHIGNPNDRTLVQDAVQRHIKKTGKVPREVVTDRGFSGAKNEQELEGFGVKHVSIPKIGKKTTKRTLYEKQPWFKRLQRWRAGVEGTISVLKRKYGLGRSLSRGHERVGTWIGFGVLTYNLRRLATMK